MKKLIAALLVLTMVLTLTGTAMAGCKIKLYDHVKFTKNTTAYDGPHNSDKTDTIVRKGSIALVVDTCGDKWVKLALNAYDATKTGWFKVDNLKKTDKYMTLIKAGKKVLDEVDIYVIYSNAGVGGSDAVAINIPDTDAGWRISPDCIKHVKATSKVWLHREPSLKKNYGKALRKDQKVKYRRVWGYDTRKVGFYGVRYEGKCLWVSAAYTELVK